MTTPTITLYPDTLPAKEQANAAFDTNVDNFMNWLTATNGPELQTMITYTQDVADNVLATALAGNLPPLTGKAGDYIRANAAEDGGEFRTPAQVLADIEAAPLASPALTGAPTAPTAPVGTNTAQIATTAMVQASLGGYGTSVATTSGTAFDFTGIPAGVRELKFVFDGIASSGTDQIIIQIGSSAGIVTSGYLANGAQQIGSAISSSTSTAGFILRTTTTGRQMSGTMTITRTQSGGFRFVSDHVVAGETISVCFGGGVVTLPGELSQIRLSFTGSNTFDGGKANIKWSF